MKRIFTLLLIAVCSTLSVTGQINEHFENYPSITNLTNNCWQFVSVDLSKQSMVTGENSLIIIPTTSQSNNTQSNISQIFSPYINFSNGTTVSFNYKMGNRLSNNATRTIVVKLQDINGITETIATLGINSGSNTNLFSFNYTSTSQSVRKLVFEITGNGDGNSYLYMDDLVINSTYNYSSPYACSLYPVNSVMPVKLMSFTAGGLHNKVNLQWSVADNETGKYFEVQKSSDGKTFRTIAVVLVSEKSGTESYAFTDTKETGLDAYYRLQIVSNNGAVSQSRIVSVKAAGATAAGSLVILQNPVASTLLFSYRSATAGRATVNIYNASGARVLSTEAPVQAGTNAISVNLDGKLNSGTYLLEVIHGSARNVAKLIKQ